MSKLNTTTKTMTLICLTLVFSICLFMAVPAVAISLSDYNHVLSMRGYDPIYLNDYEFGIQWKLVATEEDRKEFSDSRTSLLTDNNI